MYVLLIGFIRKHVYDSGKFCTITRLVYGMLDNTFIGAIRLTVPLHIHSTTLEDMVCPIHTQHATACVNH